MAEASNLPALIADEILKQRRRTVKQSTESLLNHILLKRIKKSKEDSDQLYHNICCYIILLSGIGDPTNDEVLKETTGISTLYTQTREVPFCNVILDLCFVRRSEEHTVHQRNDQICFEA